MVVVVFLEVGFVERGKRGVGLEHVKGLGVKG